MKCWVAIAIALFGVIVIADMEDPDSPSMTDMKGPAAPTVVTLRTIREDDQESHIAYIDSPLDPADGAVALPEKVNGPLGAKKWIEDMSQNPLYKAPPPVVPTPTKRVEVDPILMPHVVPRDIRQSVNHSILAFAKALGKPASKRRAPSAQLRNELLKLETAIENSAPDAIIQKLHMNVAAAEQNMNANADLLKSTALQAKSNLTQAEAALDAAMATANASVELNNWLRSARANHEDDKANVLMPEIDTVNERQKALFQQLVAAEKNATSIMFNAIKAAIKNRRLNETPRAVVQVLSGDKWVSPKAVKKENSTNATKVQPNATNATDDEELEEEEETRVPVRHDHTVFKNHPPQNSAKFGTTCTDRLDCSDHGQCRRGVCLCNKGWTYYDCSMRHCEHGHWRRYAKTGFCADCLNSKSLMPLYCYCEEGWYGPSCNKKMCPGSTGEKFVCSGHGACVGGVCDCEEEYDGAGCSIHKCTNQGEYVNGTCKCFEKYWGPACENRMCEASKHIRKTPDEIGRTVFCNNHGKCTSGGMCEQCDQGYGGPGCCLGGCSGRGECYFDGCACNAGFQGSACEFGPCPNRCSGHGTCHTPRDRNSSGCVCDEGYKGDSCNILDCSFNHQCSGHGKCDNRTGVCECDGDFTGDDCSQLRCPNACKGIPMGNVSRGSCHNGTCNCLEEFQGPACEEASCYKFKGCSGHGSCFDGSCSCDSGWAGLACDENVNKSCPLSCSNHGYCNAASGKCDCDYGYHGTGCSSLRCFHGSLFYKAGDSANATMVDVEDGVAPANSQQTCVCENGWEGHHCNTTVTKGERLSGVVDTVLNASHQHSVATGQLAAESEEDEQKAKLRQDDSSGVN